MFKSSNIEANDAIKKIKEAPLLNKQDALNLLGITDPSAPVTDIIKAFKKLAILVHPDKQSDKTKEGQETASEAFVKLQQAKDWAISTSDSPFLSGFTKFSSGDDLFALFNPENSYMKGPIVRKMRDIILTWASHFTRVINLTKAAEIRQFFRELNLNNAAVKDKQELLAYVNLLFPDAEIPSCSIANKFPSQNLNDGVLFLSSLAIRYPELRSSYQNVFKEKVVKFLSRATESLGSTVKKLGFSGKFDLLGFSTFTQFANAFAGAQKENWNTLTCRTLTAADPGLQDAFMLLDDCIKENPILFSNLVQAANFLRAQFESKAPFIYSETALEEDSQKAQQVNRICEGVTKLEVLNAQLSYIMQLILGKHFSNTAPSELQSRFPAQHCIYHHEFLYENKQPIRKYTNIFTQEVIQKPPERFDPILTNPKNYIHAVIPEKSSDSIIDAYQKHYRECDGVSLVGEIEGENYLEYSSAGLLETPIIDQLEKTWVNLPAKELSKEQQRSQSIPLPQIPVGNWVVQKEWKASLLPEKPTENLYTQKDYLDYIQEMKKLITDKNFLKGKKVHINSPLFGNLFDSDSQPTIIDKIRRVLEKSKNLEASLLVNNIIKEVRRILDKIDKAEKTHNSDPETINFMKATQDINLFKAYLQNRNNQDIHESVIIMKIQ
jgi:hypothetical protein